MSSSIAPKRVIDRNGKETTVHARTDNAPVAGHSRLSKQGVADGASMSKYHASLRFTDQLNDIGFASEDGDNKAAGRNLADSKPVFGTIGERRVCVQAYGVGDLFVTDDAR